jgi:hypothetical protein
MKILVDCDVLLDVALARAPFTNQSREILLWAEANPGQACIAWHTCANLAYLCGPGSRGFLESLLEFIEIAEVGTNDLKTALTLRIPNLEDAMQAAAALAFGADRIVTRNVRDYRYSPIPVVGPGEFVRR